MKQVNVKNVLATEKKDVMVLVSVTILFKTAMSVVEHVQVRV